MKYQEIKARVLRALRLSKPPEAAPVQRMYQAARQSRLTADWTTATTSADAEIRSSLTALRARCRALGRDSAYAKRAKTIVVNNVVGSGIGLQAQVRSSRKRFMPKVNEAIEDTFKRWSRARFCHTGGGLDFASFERALMSEVFEAGEVFVRMHLESFGGSDIPFALELIESERIPHTVQPSGVGAGNEVRMGIDVDEFYRPIAYWIRDHHPSDFHYPSGFRGPEEIRRIPASEIIHLRVIDRWPQTRGVPWLHAVAKKLNDMDGYSEAEIVSARGAANYMGTIETDPMTPVGEEQEDGTRQMEVAPGIVLKMAIGEKFNFVAPNRPNVALDPFMRYMLRETAAGAGVSYESISRDYCVAPDTRVLRADLRWVRADELHDGTEIVAFDEEIPGGMGRRRKWRKASVVRAGRRNLNRRRIITDQAAVTVSDGHLFLCVSRAKNSTRSARGQSVTARSEKPGGSNRWGHHWVRADRLQPGDQIVFLAAPWATGSTHLHGYLKGIADGEGWIEKKTAAIGIAQNPGAVLDEIDEALSALGFDAWCRPANGNGKTMKRSIIGIGQCLRFLGEVRPTRLLQHAESVYEGRAIASGSKMKASERPTAATVLAVEDIGVGPVVTLETSTRTLITEGLCSHNSQSNYSSSRLALLDDRDTWRVLQTWFIRSFRDLIHGRWLQQAVLARAIPSIPVGEYAQSPEKFAAVKYKPRGWSWVDPTKEVAAYKEAEKAGYVTKTQIIAQTGSGQDFEDVMDERAQELEQMAEKGLAFDTDKPTEAAAPAPGDREPLPDDDPDEDDESTDTPMRLVK